MLRPLGKAFGFGFPPGGGIRPKVNAKFQLHWLVGASPPKGYRDSAASQLSPRVTQLFLPIPLRCFSWGRNQLCIRRDLRAETEISHKDKTSALSPTSCYSWCNSQVWGRRSAGAVRTPVGQSTLTLQTSSRNKAERTRKGPTVEAAGARNCDYPGCWFPGGERREPGEIRG